MGRPVPVAVVLCLAVTVAAAASLVVGPNESTPSDTWQALFAPTGTATDLAIRAIRLPRTLAGLLVGAGLGVAGVLVQGHTRNPMADPGLLGINQGAALAIVWAAGGSAALPSGVLAVIAGIGALVTTALVLGIASRRRLGITPLTLVLGGAAVSALCAAMVNALILNSTQTFEVLRYWQVGSLTRQPESLGVIALVIGAGGVLALAGARQLDALALGDDTAVVLGVSLARARVLGIVAVALLAAGAVAVAGPIAFIGLLVPHLVRQLGVQSYTWQLPAGALCGAAVLTLADVAARMVVRPGELPVGVLTAVLGAPLFVVLARRKRQVQL